MNATTTPTDPLDAMAAQAATLESDFEAAPGADQAAPVQLTNVQAIAGAIGAGREAFCFFTKLESPRRVLVDDTVQQLAALWAPVADKHGFNLGDYLGDYALELAAAIGTFTIVAQLRSAVALEIAEKQKHELHQVNNTSQIKSDGSQVIADETTSPN